MFNFSLDFDDVYLAANEFYFDGVTALEDRENRRHNFRVGHRPPIIRPIICMA